MGKSEELFELAVARMPGGVNSPVRSFRAVGGVPRFIRSGKGCRLTDEDGAEYLDYIGSWGPMILGHAHPAVLQAVMETAARGLSFGAATALEVELAGQMIRMVRPLEMVRMVNSGTEAVMSALRLARAYTGRDRIIKFEGCYHGHCDSMLVKAGSGALTAGVPDSPGVPASVAADTLNARYNDSQSVEDLLNRYSGQVAAVIVEPVAANMGVVPPEPGFLQSLRDLCDRHGCLLIFDEVITGFRLAPGGAMDYFGIEADLAVYGKIIGGGMPVGAYGGRQDIMKMVAPSGGVYQAGTLSGNPVAMAAGLAVLQQLEKNPGIYGHLEGLAIRLEQGLYSLPATRVNRCGSLLNVFFTDRPVRDLDSARTSDLARFSRFFSGMLKRGILFAPAQFEAWFLSQAHTEKEILETLAAVDAWKEEQ